MIGYKCPACKGMGGAVVPITDLGEGPWEPCGFCRATGTIPFLDLQALYWARRLVRAERNAKRARMGGAR